MFKEHFAPKVNHAYERYMSNCMKPREGKTFNEFLTAARLQAKGCQFSDLADEPLRDRIIVDITNDNIRERLLSYLTVDLQKAVNLCRASKQASQQLKEITNKETKTVDTVTKKSKSMTKTTEQAPSKHKPTREYDFCGKFTDLGSVPHVASRAISV